MAQFLNMYTVDLAGGAAPVVALRQIYYGDELANRVGAMVVRYGEPVALTGSCSASVIRADGTTVPVSGTVSGNEAYVELPAACYAVEGAIQVFVKFNGVTLLEADGTVRQTETGAVIEPTDVIVVSDLIAAINEAVESIPQDYATLDGTVKSHTGMLAMGDAVTVPFAIDDDGSIKAADGTIATSSTFSYTDYIDISAYAFITYKRVGVTGSVTAGMAFYDKNKTYLAGALGAKNQAEAGYLTDGLLVPENAKYARFTVFTDTGSRGDFSATGYPHVSAEANANFEAFDKRIIPPTMLAQGTISGTSGNNSDSDTRVRTPRRVHPSVRRVIADNGYSVAAFAYSVANDSYQGRILTAGGLSKVSDTGYTLGWMQELDLWTLATIYPGYYWRLVFRKDDDTDQTPVDIAAHVTYIIDRERASGAFFPTQRVPADTAAVYALYDAFVDAGIATKTTLATVEGLPIYQYDFKALDGWMDGEDYEIDTSGDRLFPKYQILFTSGMHGDEKSAVLGLYEFMNLVANDPQYVRYLALCDIHVIPVCNPTGYNANSRNNYQGKNINRLDTDTETGGGNTVEAIAIKGVIDSQAYDLYIDLHNMRTDTASASTPGASGGMSFANATPEALMTKEYRTYMEATTHTTQVMLDELSDITNNARQAFYPWKGQNVNSFRQYGLTHQSGGVNVGAPVSGTFEVSRRCYSLTGSNVDYNGYAIMICDQCAIDTLGLFITRVTEGRLA